MTVARKVMYSAQKRSWMAQDKGPDVVAVESGCRDPLLNANLQETRSVLMADVKLQCLSENSTSKLCRPGAYFSILYDQPHFDALLVVDLVVSQKQ